MRLTIGIKALNEEKHIAAALASAVEAAEPFAGEVVLADSGSIDRTIDIARRFPVRIVQLADPGDRSCGAGAQLAYQHAKGDYFYLLDGDMVLSPAFIAAGLDYLEANPDVAGVGGRVHEVNTDNEEFRIRAATVRNDRNWAPGSVDRLDCGGLYRVSAVREVGYFADRNLHAFEEFELGARLLARGWKLARIDCAAVQHFGHTMDGYALLWRRMRSGYAGATGEVLRAAIGTHHLPIVLRRLGHIRNGAAVILWWLLLITAVFLEAPIEVGLLIVVPILWLWFRRRSLSLAIYSLISWNSAAWGLITGFLRKRVPPSRPLAAKELASEKQADIGAAI